MWNFVENRKCVQVKKIIIFVLAAVLAVGLVPGVLAAGSASLSGPDTVRAGDAITLSFYAGGGIYGGSGQLSYDASRLTLESVSPQIGGSWAVEFSGDRFVFYDNSMASPIDGSTKIFTATFRVSAGLEPGTEISVTAKGVTLSDGKQDTSAGSPSYRVTLAKPLSGNCNLASLTAEGVTLSPAFSADVTKYSARVPYSVSKLDISAQAEHENAKVKVENPTLYAGDTTVIKVTVTAETGAQKEYKLYVARDQDPNYVPSANTALEALQVEGYSLSPAFQKDVKQYYVWLPYETETVTLSADAEDGKAKVTAAECPALQPGKGTDIAVTVKAENGTEAVYTVTVVRAPAPEDVEAFLSGQREPEETEPVTEPTTEPTAAPTTEPTTAPTAAPTAPPEPTQPPLPQDPLDSVCTLRDLLIIGGLCIIAGLSLGVMIALLIKRRR